MLTPPPRYLLIYLHAAFTPALLQQKKNRLIGRQKIRKRLLTDHQNPSRKSSTVNVVLSPSPSRWRVIFPPPHYLTIYLHAALTPALLQQKKKRLIGRQKIRKRLLMDHQNPSRKSSTVNVVLSPPSYHQQLVTGESRFPTTDNFTVSVRKGPLPGKSPHLEEHWLTSSSCLSSSFILG